MRAGKLVILFLTVLSSHALFANDLADAFDALTNNTRPGVYESQVRGFMTGGGFSVSFPQHRVNFISITPPQINAGCGGISMFTGGFSYISGDEFVAMLKGIAADSLGEAFAIAVRTLCPVCATVLSDLQKAAQLASRLAIDQCSAAMGLLEQGIESVPGLQKFLQSRAALDKSGSNEENSFLSAMDKYTGRFEQAIQRRVNDLRKLTDGPQREEALNRSPLGNSTWKAVQGMDDAQKTMILSLLGTNLQMPDGDKPDASDAKSVKQVPVSPTLTIADLARLLIFGVDGKTNQQLALLECPERQAGELWHCLKPQTVVIKSSRWYRQNTGVSGGVSLINHGFYGLTYALLLQAVSNVTDNKPLDTPQSITLPIAIYPKNTVIKAHFTLSEIQGFISVANLPLYRAINLASFYPDLSQQLIGNIADVVATQYAVAYIDHYFLNTKKTHQKDAPAGEQGIDQRLLGNVQRAIRELRVNLHQQQTLLLTRLQAQTAWIAQLNQIQETVYQELLQEGLDANLAFGLGLSGS